MSKHASCPHCGKLIDLVGVKGKERGYALARETVLERMKTYCTPEAHRARLGSSKTKYCDLCHRDMTKI